MKSRTSWMLILIAFGMSILMTWIGGRPGEGDTSIVVGVILFSTWALGFFSPPRERLWATVVGCGIPLVGLLVTHQSGTVVALLFGVIGASAGALGRKVFTAFQTAFT